MEEFNNMKKKWSPKRPKTGKHAKKVVAIVAGVISDWLLHNNFPAAVTMAVFGLIGTMAFAYAYPPTLAPIACALVVSQSGSIVLALAGVGSFLPKLVSSWGAVASVVYFFRNVER